MNVNGENVHVVDADQLFMDKVGQLPEAPPDDGDYVSKYGFDPYGDGDASEAGEDPSVSALFEENAGGMTDDDGAGFVVKENAAGPDGMEDGDGFFEGLSPEAVDSATMGEGVYQATLEKASAQAQELIDQANEQAQQIVQQAMAEAEMQAGQMLERAKEQGHAEGYEAGQAQARAIADDAKKEYEAKAMELQQEYDEKLRMIEPHLIEELTGIYEHIFTVDLSGYRSVINHLITNTLHALEASSTYLIHVSPADISALSMQKAQLRKEANIPDGATMELVEDISLGKNQCLIETDDGIFDCSLTVELAELKKKLMLLAYEGTRN